MTVYGNLDSGVSLHGIFHFVEEPDGLVSVSYAVNTLEAELSTPGIKSSIKSVLGVQEEVPLNPDIAASYLAKSALDELHKLGVTTLPPSGHGIGEQISNKSFAGGPSPNLHPTSPIDSSGIQPADEIEVGAHNLKRVKREEDID